MSSKSTDSDSVSTDSSIDTFKATDHVCGHNEKVQKRSDWEAFSFRVLSSGNVLVVNGSHDNPAEHAYVVTTDSEGLPKWCLKVLDEDAEDDWGDCPAMAYHCVNDDDVDTLTAKGEYEVCKHGLAYANHDVLVHTVRQIKQGDMDAPDVDVHEAIRSMA